MKEYRDVFLDHLNVFSKLDGFGKIMADEFERMYNILLMLIHLIQKQCHVEKKTLTCSDFIYGSCFYVQLPICYILNYIRTFMIC